MSVDPNPQTLPFSIENAFTDRIEGGNPAVVVRVPSLTALPDTTLQTIATNFNQPITVFIAPRETNASDPSGTATFGIRWFGPLREARLCGHGTLAAAAAVFRSAKSAQDPTAIRFEARTGKHLVARQVEDGCVEIDLDAGRAEALVGAEDAQLREVLVRALGKDVRVTYTGRGMGHLDPYALIEVDTHDLKGIKVDTEALVSLPRLVWTGVVMLIDWG
jgi:PhzF family phenazine biosynthesis protein